jgi:hypothetical protein
LCVKITNTTFYKIIFLKIIIFIINIMRTFSYGNTTGLGTQGRTGPAILVASVRSNAGSIGRIYSSLKPKARPVFYKNQANFLYGPGGSAPRRGITGGLFG